MHHQNIQDTPKAVRISKSLLEQEYVAVAILIGNDFVIEQANKLVCKIWGRTQKQVLNLPLFDALPEIVNNGIEELLQKVVDTGEPYIGKEMPVPLKRNGRSEEHTSELQSH